MIFRCAHEPGAKYYKNEIMGGGKGENCSLQFFKPCSGLAFVFQIFLPSVSGFGVPQPGAGGPSAGQITAGAAQTSAAPEPGQALPFLQTFPQTLQLPALTPAPRPHQAQAQSRPSRHDQEHGDEGHGSEFREHREPCGAQL